MLSFSTGYQNVGCCDDGVLRVLDPLPCPPDLAAVWNSTQGIFFQLIKILNYLSKRVQKYTK